MQYKIRIYHTFGPQKGNLQKEEFFSTAREMAIRFRELFRPGMFTLNPTAWKNESESADGEAHWKRMTLQEVADIFMAIQFGEAI